MLNLGSQIARNCNGVSRRAMLQMGGMGILGLSLPRLLAAEAAQPAASRQDINCILLWMGGGPSNIDTFDMKPEAPVEYRGEFSPISSNLPGADVCEHLPMMARHMDKICLVKSVTHTESGDHTAATHYLLTGYPQRPDPSGQPAGALIYPSYGSVIGKEKGWQQKMPPYISLGVKMTPYARAGYLGSQHDPMVIPADPNDPKFSVEDLTIADAVGGQRTERRRSMLSALDRWQRTQDKLAGPALERNQFYQQAYDLMTSPTAKKAFRLEDEPTAVRERYGRSRFGQQCLLARRLIEAGVRFVNVNTHVWDTHINNFPTLKEATRLPDLDRYWSALLDDLSERGLLDKTLVVWMGEFGRTPRVNGGGGRDHWAPTNTICLSGAGVKMGQVIGKTDKLCERTIGTVHSTHDFAATLYRLMGIDSTK